MSRIIFLITAALMTFISSCMKDSFDTPDTIKDPNLTANYTINDLKAAYSASGKVVMSITGDYIISGIVTADDKSGNFYKEIVIQEETTGGGAIGVKIDRSNLYNDLPIGRRVFIKLKGMAVSNYNNLVQLGGYVDTVTVPGSESLGSIPSSQIGVKVIKGSLGHTIAPEDISDISALSTAYQYKLIRLLGVEFDCSVVTSTYADAINQADADRMINTPNGKTIIVRNSGYSNFAALKVNPYNGDLTAIYTVYRTTKQLKIRDTADIKFRSNNSRITSCGGSGGGGGGGTSVLKTIGEIRAMYSGIGVKLDGYYIEGTVISDKDNKNINSQNFAVQDASGGIIIRFSSAHSFAMGDKVKVSFTGDSLTKYAGLMQVYIPAANCTKIGTGTITPATVTIATINNNFSQYESTLVKVDNASFSTSGTYSGSKSLSDGSANITHYTTSSATFAGSALPSGAKSFTGIVGVFNSTKQLSIRNLNDVQ